MAAKHKFGMKIRLVLPFFAKQTSFVAFYTWKHSVNDEEFLSIVLQHDPSLWVKIGDKKVLLVFAEDSFCVDMDKATYDLRVELKIDDPEDPNYLTTEELLERIELDPNWQNSQISKLF